MIPPNEAAQDRQREYLRRVTRAIHAGQPVAEAPKAVLVALEEIGPPETGEQGFWAFWRWRKHASASARAAILWPAVRRAVIAWELAHKPTMTERQRAAQDATYCYEWPRATKEAIVAALCRTGQPLDPAMWEPVRGVRQLLLVGGPCDDEGHAELWDFLKTWPEFPAVAAQRGAR